MRESGDQAIDRRVLKTNSPEAKAYGLRRYRFDPTGIGDDTASRQTAMGDLAGDMGCEPEGVLRVHVIATEIAGSSGCRQARRKHGQAPPADPRKQDTRIFAVLEQALQHQALADLGGARIVEGAEHDMLEHRFDHADQRRRGRLQRAQLVEGGIDLASKLLDRLVERNLGRKMTVEQRLRDPGPLGDLLRCRPSEAFAREERHGGLNDRPLPCRRIHALCRHAART